MLGKAIAALALLLVLAAPASAASLTVAHATFPERVLVLGLPHSAPLTSAGVRVSENGQRVTPIQVIGRDSRAIGFVLAVDESASMQGRPLTDALAAARAFAAHRGDAQSLGLVTFNASTTVALAPTTDAAAIDSVLARSGEPAVGTRLWDAVARSIRLLHDSGVQAGSVVVLSDGRDTRSTLTAEEVVRQARADAVRVFTVGLRSPQFDPAALRALASATGGAYAETTSQGLVGVYSALGARLANEYLVQYRSSAPRGTTVHVTVVVPAFGRDAGTATVTYAAPLPPGGGVLQRSGWERFWDSRAGLAVVALVAAMLAGFSMILALRSVRRRPLTKRIDSYLRGGLDAHEAPLGPELPSPVARSLRRLHGWEGFEDDLAIGRVGKSGAQLVAYAAGGAVAIVLCAAALGQAWVAVLALAPFLAVRAYASRRATDVRRRFESQLPDTLQVLASALRAGHGMTGAIRLAVADASEPMKSELDRAVAEEQLGVPLDEAFGVIAGRMRSDDLEHLAFVAGVHRQTGGNTAEVLDRIHDAIRERFELRRAVQSLTAQARMTRWILTLLPVGLALFLLLTNPGYMEPLTSTTVGHLLVALAVVMVVSGFFAIKRLTEIEV